MRSRGGPDGRQMKSPNMAQALLLRLGTVPRTSLLGGIAAVILSVVIAIAFLLFGSNGDDPVGATESPFQAQADSVATAVASGLVPYRKVLNDLATNMDVATTLRDGDEVARRALATRLTPALDGVLALRVLPAAWRDPDPSATPPLTYAAVSMVIQARETGADVPAEAHLSAVLTNSSKFSNGSRSPARAIRNWRDFCS